MPELLPLIRQRFCDDAGVPLAGGKMYSYVANTSTPVATFTDRGGGTPNENPIILDANGECDIWIGPGYFKFVLTDADDVEVWTRDNISLVTNSSESLPAGGLGGMSLIKLSDADFNASWAFISGVPNGGTTGQALVKDTDTDQDVSWKTLAKGDVGLGDVDNTADLDKPISTATQAEIDATAAALEDMIDDVAADLATGLSGKQNTLPAGTDGQVLTLVSGLPAWEDPGSGIPIGGTVGQVLTKLSSTDGDADWEDPGESLPAGGTAGQILTKISGTDGDADWQDAEPSFNATPVRFFSPAGNGALPGEAYGLSHFEFPKDAGLKVTTLVQVPVEFEVGDVLPRIRLPSYSLDGATRSWAFQVTASLFSYLGDALSAPTVTRIGTSGDCLSGNAQPDVAICVLTDSGAVIDGEAIAGTDYIKIEIERVAPSSGTEATGSVYLLADAGEVLWT